MPISKKQLMSDHDLIVRLDTKMDQLSIDVNDLKTGTSQTLAHHETRIAAIERIHDEINPMESARRLNEIAEKQHDFQVVWKYVIATAVFLSSAITFIMTLIVQVFHLLGKW